MRQIRLLCCQYCSISCRQVGVDIRISPSRWYITNRRISITRTRNSNANASWKLYFIPRFSTDYPSIREFDRQKRKRYQNKKKTQCRFHIHCSLIPLYKNTSFCQVYIRRKPGDFNSRQSLQFSEIIAYYLSCVFCIG